MGIRYRVEIVRVTDVADAHLVPTVAVEYKYSILTKDYMWDGRHHVHDAVVEVETRGADNEIGLMKAIKGKIDQEMRGRITQLGRDKVLSALSGVNWDREI